MLRMKSTANCRVLQYLQEFLEWMLTDGSVEIMARQLGFYIPRWTSKSMGKKYKQLIQSMVCNGDRQNGCSSGILVMAAY